MMVWMALYLLVSACFASFHTAQSESFWAFGRDDCPLVSPTANRSTHIRMWSQKTLLNTPFAHFRWLNVKDAAGCVFVRCSMSFQFPFWKITKDIQMLHRHCRPIRLTLPNGIFIASRIQYPLHKGAAHHFRHHVVRRSVLHYQALYLSRGSARYGRACKKYSREAIQIDGMAVVVHHYLAISHSYHCLRNLDDS